MKWRFYCLSVMAIAAWSAVAATPPAVRSIHPRGLQRGGSSTLTLDGSNLVQATEAAFSHPRISATWKGTPTETRRELAVSIPADVPRGAYELFVKSPAGESGRVRIWIDDIPQVSEEAPRDAGIAGASGPIPQKLPGLPASVWGALEKPGDADEFEFEASQGDRLVLDLQSAGVGGKAEAILTILDSKGRVLQSSYGFDSDGPLAEFEVPATGLFRARVTDQKAAGSADHLYRLIIGKLSYVTGIFPLSVPSGKDSSVELVGINLPPGAMASVASAKPGESAVSFDPERFRFRHPFKVTVEEDPLLAEQEPNDRPREAQPLPLPGIALGRIQKPDDVDCFRFHARKGEPWIFETLAARQGTPLDTRLEIVNAEGSPVDRVWLQAVRNSAVTFRGIDSVTLDARVENWEEMELNQLLYIGGEAVRLFRAPQGPDSGFNFYASNGKRRNYFDTTATAHALDEPCYIVEPHPPGDRLVPNGLPVFKLGYVNDDDANRKLGSDSRLVFSAPADGDYVARISDTRGFGGSRFAYSLKARRPQPGFQVSLGWGNPPIAPGNGQSFTVTAERVDGFEGPIAIEITGMPAGFRAMQPLTIEAGHSQAFGTVYAASTAVTPPAEAPLPQLIAAAAVNGREVRQPLSSFGRLQKGEPAKLQVSLDPDRGPVSTFDKPAEITLEAGKSVPAWLRVKRNGFEELITFTVDNLPHGVIVDNIGLNGVLIPKGQSERQIFLTAARWVPECDRLCYAVENQAGRQTSHPVLIHIRKGGAAVSAR